MGQIKLSLNPATIQARNDVGGYFLERYSLPDGSFAPVNAMSAIGAVAGAFAHRQALFMLVSGALPADKVTLLNVAGADGRTYWFGDAINYVVYEARGPDLSLFALVAAAAGVDDPGAAIDIVAIFQHAAATVGAGGFGEPRATALPRPTETIFDALAAHVTIIKDRLAFLGVPNTDFATVFGAAAQGLVPLAAGERADIPVTERLSRVAAVQLFFEAAIPASKLDPALTGV